jgi:hypothetical protein
MPSSPIISNVKKNKKQKTLLLYSTDEESSSTNDSLSGIKQPTQHNDSLLKDDSNSSNLIVEQDQKIKDSRIVMKIFREQNNTYNASISCSEDESSPPQPPPETITIKENLPKLTISVSSIISTKTSDTTIIKPKPVPTNRGKDLSLISKNYTNEPIQYLKPKSVEVDNEINNKKRKKVISSLPTQVTQPAKPTITEIEKTKTVFKIPRIVREIAVVPTPVPKDAKITPTTKTTTTTPIVTSLSNLPARKSKTKQKNPIKKVPNKKLPIPVPKNTRQHAQLIESEKKQAYLQTNNAQANVVCLTNQISLETMFCKVRELDEIYIDNFTFNLINANAFNNTKYDYGLSYLSLDDRAKMHLLKLMRRRVYVNPYEVFADEADKKFDNSDIIFDENNMVMDPLLDYEENWIMNAIKCLNFEETLAVVAHFKTMLTAPFRTFEVFDDGMCFFLFWIFN